MSTYKTKWGRSIAVAMAAALVFTGLPGTETQAAKKAKLSTKKLTVTVGKKKTIKIKNKAKKAKYTFKSKKASIAKVSKKGVVIGKKKGSTKITVTEKKGKKTRKLGTVKVTVKPVKKPAASKAPSQPTAPVVAPSTNPTQPTKAPDNPGQGTPQPQGSTQPSKNPATPPVKASEPPTPPPTDKPSSTEDPNVPGTVTPKPETPPVDTSNADTSSGEKPGGESQEKDRVFTNFGDATVKYEFENIFTSQATVAGYTLTEEQKTKLKALTDEDSIEVTTSVQNVTDKTNQGLQVAFVGSGEKVHMAYVGNIDGKNNKVKIPVSNLASNQYGTQAIKLDEIQKIELRVAYGGTFDGDVELTSIKFGNNEADTITGVKSDKNTITGLKQWSPLGISFNLPSDVDMTKYSKIRVEATISGSDVAINANLKGEGCGQYGKAGGIVGGVAEFEIPAGVTGGGSYSVDIGTAEDGFNGSCELTKITLIP